MAAIPYLIFPGTCREAMEYYRDALDGEITIMQTIGESPIDAPPDLAERIFNSEVQAGSICLKASDDQPTHPVNVGNNVCLFVTFPNEAAKRRAAERLGDGGKVLFPIEDNFGMLEDKFGIRWMVMH